MVFIIRVSPAQTPDVALVIASPLETNPVVEISTVSNWVTEEKLILSASNITTTIPDDTESSKTKSGSRVKGEP
jgi:hypothetical protein